MISIIRTAATRQSATRDDISRQSHKRPQTCIGVMFGAVRAKRGKTSTGCAKPRHLSFLPTFDLIPLRGAA